MKIYATLKELGEVITGNTPKTSEASNYISNDIPFLKPSDLHENEIWELDRTENYISEHAREQARIVPKGAVLCTCIGIIGKIGITARDCAFNQQINAIIPDVNKVNKHYLAYAISAQKRYMQDKANAAVVPIINKTQFGELSVRIRPLDEQLEIAHNLKVLEHLIANRQQASSVLDDLVKSRFIEMFGDPVTNPMRWEEHRLDEYITFLTSGSRGWSKYFSDDGEIFITIKNVKNNRITLDNVQYVIPPNNAEAQRTKVREGDLLISITADLGRTGVVSREIAEQGAYINQHLTCIRLKQGLINPSYVSYFMESDAGKRQFDAKNQSAVKAGLNFDAIKSLELLVPPLDLQNEYISFVEQTDKSKFAVQQSIDTLQTLKAKLMQDYFG